MLRYIVLICICASSSLSFRLGKQGCTISINNDLGEPQPLILNPTANKIVEPSIFPDLITLNENAKIRLACPGSYLQIYNKKFTDLETATCSSGQFLLRDLILNFEDITCESNPFSIAKFTGKPCEEDNKEVEIGFQVRDTFLRHIQICFDDKLQTTLYSHFTLKPSIRGHQSNYSRPYWINDNFYNFGGDTANTLYTQKRQKDTINRLLGLPPDSTKYVQPSSYYYLARGHLSAKADFIYGSQQSLTFHLINVAPQWQIFNGGNWEIVEFDVRDFVIDRNIVLEVYTGTYGVMTLPHEQTEEDIEIYLYDGIHGEIGLPVPALYWKLLYDPIAESGIVLIGINSPYLENTEDLEICEDVSDEISWGTWSRNDIDRGYIYACSVPDFAEKVSYLPKLNVNKLLI